MIFHYHPTKISHIFHDNPINLQLLPYAHISHLFTNLWSKSQKKHWLIPMDPGVHPVTPPAPRPSRVCSPVATPPVTPTGSYREFSSDFFTGEHRRTPDVFIVWITDSNTHRIHGAGIYANIGDILMGSMLPYIAAPWIRHGIYSITINVDIKNKMVVKRRKHGEHILPNQFLL